MNRKIHFLLAVLVFSVLACANENTEDSAHTEDAANMTSSGAFHDRDALPNDSGIEGVQTFPDRIVYHDHVKVVEEPVGEIPPAFGAHLAAWQNCGIYDQPIGLGNALHSLEHGAVWVTYPSDLPADQVEALRAIVRGNDFVLMSLYPKQTKPVILTAWTVQLVIESMPDDRIAKFIEYYSGGPQNPEPGASCEGAIGTPIE